MDNVTSLWNRFTRQELLIVVACLAIIVPYAIKGLGALRTIVLIRKDWLHAKKTSRELERQDDPPRIRLATLEDVKKYDFKTKTIVQVASSESEEQPTRYRPPTLSLRGTGLAVLAVLVLVWLILCKVEPGFCQRFRLR